MTKREEEKRKSLADLARVAEKAEAMPWLDKRVAPPPPPKPAAPPPRAAPRPAPPPTTPSPSDAERARRAKLADRKAKLEEERALKQRRAGELSRATNLQWRGMSWGDVPSSIRRTPFDRAEPSVTQKITDVLGDAKEKEGRAKHRAKGKKQGARGP